MIINNPKSVATFWLRVKWTNECWEWQGAIDKGGYGKFHCNDRWNFAHRCSYELIKGEIPKGLTIDHLCRNRLCVNPEHLEPVSIGENVLRGQSIPARNKLKTHCKRGHPLSGDNLRINKTTGQRECRTCRNHQDRTLYHKTKEGKTRIIVKEKLPITLDWKSEELIA